MALGTRCSVASLRIVGGIAISKFLFLVLIVAGILALIGFSLEQPE